VHLRLVGSTNDRARALASAGAPHGTLVTADEQSAGHGRQGRAWVAPAREALLMSVILRDPPELLPLAAAVAVAEAVGPAAAIKWPNDVLVAGRKVAGILVEGRPQEGWAVLGIGVNVAVRAFPPELRDVAGSLGRPREAVEPFLAELVELLAARLGAPAGAILDAWRARDALRAQAVAWSGGEGRAAGVDGAGRLVVELADGGTAVLDAGEVHLRRADAGAPPPR
jgi:BirA family biotin operon repressor/biotin-[acetyl-CoA-carboxylase] ligase